MANEDLLLGRSVTVIAGNFKVTGLRMGFDITRSTSKTPNTAEVTIYNLSPSQRAALQAKGQNLVVEAGYGVKAGTIFAGTIRTATSTHDGPDWITKLKSADGELPYRSKRCVESFKAGTPISAVVKRICDVIGIPAQTALAKIDAAQYRQGAVQFLNGTTVDGPAQQALDSMMQMAGLEWSIQDGALQVLTIGAALDGDAVLLSGTDKQTGLIGSPEVAEKAQAAGATAAAGTDQSASKSKAPRHIIKVNSLLNPRIRPGTKLKLESSLLQGYYRVDLVKHIGDTHDVPFYSQMECRAL